ncbi:hypothetical protein RYA05_04360 [Pseudomonas syringae pv. actinidiae]|nr:hypothetical protein [Pseudomonas syringae pv. actinidiae]
MTKADVDPDFPDTFYVLMLSAEHKAAAPTLSIKARASKLVDGVYLQRSGHELYADTLMIMYRNNRGDDLCRNIHCLEHDIPEATRLMRVDILREAEHRLEKAQRDLALFQLDPL